MAEEIFQKVKAVVFGHAVGDAVGGPVQFLERELLDKTPVADMLPLEGVRFPKGSWSDDTSMSLCAMDAIINHGLNFDKVMENFVRWLYGNEFTPTGIAFDVGGACFTAINRYRKNIPAEQCGCRGEYENGNGSLMRIYPFSLYAYFSDCPPEGKIDLIHRASALTHAHMRSCVGCGIYSFVFWELLKNQSKQAIYDGLKKSEKFYRGEQELKFYQRLFADDFAQLPRRLINSSGYVVDTLEAAIWCVLTTENFRDCILKAVNLGSDTDTVGAVAGSLAGLLYGVDGIPAAWINSLCKKDYFEEIINKFCYTLYGITAHSEHLKFQNKRDGSSSDFFFLIGENCAGKEVADMVLCNGNSSHCWNKAENYTLRGDEEIVVIFEYQQKIMSDTATNGLAFTTYSNYKRYLCALSDKNLVASHVVAPLWDYTAIYRIPNFSTFREARDYLIYQFGFKSENVLEWSGHEDRKYHCGLIQ